MARSRRALLAALSAALAGCGASRTDSPTPASTSDAGTPSPTPSPTDSPTDAPTGNQEPERVELDDDRLQWKVEFPGDGLTAPVAANDRLFLGAGTGTRGTPTGATESSGLLAALSLPDGEPVWHQSLAAPPRRMHAHSGALYATVGYSTGLDGVSQRLLRFGADGQRRWASPARDAWLSVYDFDADSAYLGTGDDALDPSGETTFAVTLESGQERWAVEGGDASGGRVSGDTLYADYGGTALASLATADGSERWQRPVEPLHGHARSIPEAAGQLFAAVEENQSYGIAGIDATDGSTTWTHGLERSSPFVVTSATPVGDAVVATEFGGLLFARDAATGAARWEQPFENRVTAPLSADGSLYASVLDGPVVAVDADSGAELWRAGGSEGFSRLSHAGETLLVVGRHSGATRIEARRLSDGGLRWRRSVPGTVQALERAAGTLAIATQNQTVYGLALD